MPLSSPRGAELGPVLRREALGLSSPSSPFSSSSSFSSSSRDWRGRRARPLNARPGRRGLPHQGRAAVSAAEPGRVLEPPRLGQWLGLRGRSPGCAMSRCPHTPPGGAAVNGTAPSEPFFFFFYSLLKNQPSF